MDISRKKIFFVGLFLVIILGISVLLYMGKKNNNQNIDQQNVVISDVFIDTFTGDEILNSGNVVSNRENAVLTILVPKWVMQPGFVEFIQRIRQELSTPIRIKTVATVSDFFSLAGSPEKLMDIDLVLLPHDALRIRENLLTKIDIGDDARAYTHPVFQDRIYGNTYTFIPFAIDPYVTYVHNTHTLAYEDGILTWDNLLTSVVLGGEKEKKLNIPLLFGLYTDEQIVLDKGGEIFGGYKDLLSQILYQWSTGAGISVMQDFFRLQSVSGANWWNYSGFQNLVRIVSTRNANCKIFDTLCVFAYQFADVRLGNMSDMGILRDITTGNMLTENDITVRNFPGPIALYPVRGRGFVQVRASAKEELVQRFVQRYIAYGLSNQAAMRDGVLSALTPVYDLQKFSAVYRDIIPFENTFTLFAMPGDFVSQLMKTSLSDMIQNSIAPVDFAGQLQPLWSGSVR